MFDLDSLDDLNRRLERLEATSVRLICQSEDVARNSKDLFGAAERIRVYSTNHTVRPDECATRFAAGDGR